MKVVKTIFISLGLFITSLLAIVFGFVEFRCLFAGDFLLMNNPAIGFLTYFFRGFYFLSIITLCVFIVLFMTHKKKICIILFADSIALFVGALLTFFFYDWFVALAVVAITLIPLIITSIGFFKKDDTKECRCINN